MGYVRKETSEEYDHYFDITNSCSANDCTGLIPAGLISEEDVEPYKELYNFGPPVDEIHVKNDKK